METFSAGSCIRFGWETFKKRPWFFVGVTLIIMVLSILFKPGTTNAPYWFNAIAFIISVGISILVDMGMTAFLLKAHDSVETVELKDLWHPKPFWNYFFAVLISGILTGIGLILLIVPGVILALMWMFVKYLVIDRNLGPIEAMKESARITRGHRWQLLQLLLMIIGIAILGAVCLIVGLLVAIPVISLAMVHAYKTLSKMAATSAV